MKYMLSLVLLTSGLQAAQLSAPTAMEALPAGNKPTEHKMSRTKTVPTTISGWIQESHDCCGLLVQTILLPKECQQAAIATFFGSTAPGEALNAYVASVQAKKNS